jgi:hypothetical protein
MTNEIMKVCIADEQSVPYNATNSTEVIESIKEQILEKVSTGCNFGVLGSSDGIIQLDKVAFTYNNPQIIDSKLYVDFKILDTPQGKVMKDLIDYRGTPSGYGISKKDNSIEDYTLAAVYIVESDTPSTGTDPLTEL